MGFCQELLYNEGNYPKKIEGCATNDYLDTYGVEMKRYNDQLTEIPTDWHFVKHNKHDRSFL